MRVLKHDTIYCTKEKIAWLQKNSLKQETSYYYRDIIKIITHYRNIINFIIDIKLLQC